MLCLGLNRSVMIYNICIWVLIVLSASLCHSQKQEVLMELTIPWPSGIMVDKIFGRYIADENGTSTSEREVFRVGRNQHNVISLRPEWSGMHVVGKILTPTQCQSIIKRAEDHATKFGWSKGRHVDYDIRPTQDLTVQGIYATGDETDLAAYNRLMKKLDDKLVSQFASKFGLDKSELRIDDLFITKYDASIPPKHMLGPHRDKSLWSFVLALNSEFSGGGTYFFDQQQLWKPPTGAALVFSGQALHGGSPITSGVRYIIAGFIDTLDPLSHDTFMRHYIPTYDGFGAAHGFRSGDIIIGIQVCEAKNTTTISDTGSFELGHDGSAELNSRLASTDDSGNKEVIKRMMDITPQTSDEVWQWAATSCELLTPGQPTVFRIRRFV